VPSWPDIESFDDVIASRARTGLGGGQLPGAPPRQKLINTVDGMIGDVGQHVSRPLFRVDTVQFGCADQRIDRSGNSASDMFSSQGRCANCRLNVRE
jgi:hypothetical protein